MNEFGLPRKIPKRIRRQVRQCDGFGCIICGKAIYDYKHFDPEYKDAKAHDTNGIVLLCIEHHGLKTRGLLSKDTIRKYASDPKCKQIGFSYGPFDIGDFHPRIILGQLICIGVRCLICLEGDEIFSVAPPMAQGLPFRLNANLSDINGKSILQIVDNEWRSDIANWDVDVIGPVITIRNAPREIALVLRCEPPEQIVIERLEMFHRGHVIFCKEGSDLKIMTVGGTQLSAHALNVIGYDTAIDVERNAISVGVNRIKYSVDLGSMGVDLSEKIRRNSLCECGSGIRFKHCHGRY